MGVKTSNTVDGLIERNSSFLDEIKSKTIHEDKEGDRERKKK